MKLVCINNRPIPNKHLGNNSIGVGLVEGEIYTTDGSIYPNPITGNKCYFIEETQDLKRVERFREVDNDFGEEVIKKLEESLIEEYV